jgi:hypothetical protein
MNAQDDNRPKDKQQAALVESIQSSFPSVPFFGKVTPVDGEWTPEVDDERALYDVLVGKKWTDIPSEFIRSQPDGFELLTDEAFQVFLPAWLRYSLENMEGENEVRHFIVFAFAPRQENLGLTPFKSHRLRSLNSEQQDTLRALLKQFSEREPSAFIREMAKNTLTIMKRQ